MISNFLKTGLSSLEAINLIPTKHNEGIKSTSHGEETVHLDKIVEDTLSALFVILSQRLG